MELRAPFRPEIITWTRLLCVGYALLLLTVMLTGCLGRSAGPQAKAPRGGRDLPDPEPYSSILETSYAAADNLAKILRKRKIPPDEPIIPASLVSVDDLTRSSTLGRIISEQISSRLAQHGYNIIEMKLRQESVFIKRGEGEFLLSREVRALGASRDANAVLVGTYAVSDYFIFVSIRIVRTEDSSVIAGYDYEIPNDPVSESLLR